MARTTHIKKKPLLTITAILATVYLTFLYMSPGLSNRDPNFEYSDGPARVPRIPERDFPKPKHDRKYFIYDCSMPLCGGMGDRQEGIVAAYLIAQMMGRKFGVVMTIPCDIKNFMVENNESWILPEGSLNGVSSLKYKVLDAAAWRLRESIHIGQLEDLFPKDAVLFNVNQEFVQYLKRLPRFSDLIWARNRTVQEIYNIVLRRLFKFNPQYQKLYDDFQNSVRNKGRQLVCAHIRLHTRLGDYHRDEKSEEYVNRIWRFLQIYNDSTEYRMFVATNSEFVRKEAKSKFPEVIVDVDGPIKHVDLDTDGEDSCRGLGKSLLDQMILSSCDVLLISDSGFSRVAAMLRGTDDNLYYPGGKMSFMDKDFIPPHW